MTPKTLDQIDMHGNVQFTIVPPKYFREIARNSKLARNESIAIPRLPRRACSSRIGDTLAAKTRLTTLYGLAESIMYPSELTDPEDWEYISFNSLSPYEMRHVRQDLCGVVIVRWENGDALQEISKSTPTERNGESRISVQGTQRRITCGSTADGPKTASSLHQAKPSCERAWKA